MRKACLLIIAIIFTNLVIAQSPVKWSFSAKKLDDKTFEVTFTATVSQPWHIYSQSTPEGGPLPTTFSFTKNPLVTLDGKVKEQGRLLKKHEEVFDIEVKYFDGNVTFTQKIKLKGKAQTNLSGSIEYMACNEEQCLPPATQNFNIVLKQ